MFYVYIIESLKDGTVYIGYTGDLEARLSEHNSGKTKSIKHKVPYKLIYFEAYADKSTARRRELELKSSSSKKKRVLDRLKSEATT